MKKYTLNSIWSERTGQIEVVLTIDENNDTHFITQHTPKRDQATLLHIFKEYKKAKEKYDEIWKGVSDGTTN